MYKVDIPIDPAIERALEKRRSAESARKDRIFNTRVRVMGLDLDALNQQVEEKKYRQYIETERDKAFDKLRVCQDKALLEQDLSEREKKADLHFDLTQYWAAHQRVEDSRDADLKCDLKGALRIPSPVGELGPASMQVFQGDNIEQEKWKRKQMRNMEVDLRAQKEDNKRIQMGAKHRELLMSKEMEHQDLRGVHLHALEEDCKKAARIALDSYNQALAADQAERRAAERRREDLEELAEQRHTLTCDMMTECSEAAELGGGGGRPPRVLADRWKGLRPDQLEAMHKAREQQRIQRQRERDAEKAHDAAWDNHLLRQSRAEEEEQRIAEEMRREKRIETDQYNMLLAREQQAYQEYLNKRLYTNKPTKDYFCQFNTSSR